MQRVLVFRNGSLGNTLVLVPVLRAMRARYPGLVVDVVVDRVSGAVLEDCPFVSELIPYEKRERSRFLSRHRDLVTRLRSRGYDTAVVAKRFLRNEVLARLSGAPRRVGFATGSRTPRLLTHAVPYREDRSIIETNLELLGPLGIPPAGRNLEFWWREEDVARAEAVWKEQGLTGSPVIVAHPGGATQAGRRVDLSVFLEVATAVARRGVRVLFLFAADEVESCRRITAAGHPALIGERLGTVACAMGRSRLFLGHDSGPSHLAHAVDLPGLIVYTDDPGWERHLVKWKPEGERWRALARSRVDAAYLVAAVEAALARD